MKLVRDFHPPFPLWFESAVESLQYLTGGDGGFLPSRMPIRQLLAHVVQLGAVVKNVEEITGHTVVSSQSPSCSNRFKFGRFVKP